MKELDGRVMVSRPSNIVQKEKENSIDLGFITDEQGDI